MPLNRPECRPQKFVMVTQVAAGRLVPPFNPRASRCHPPIHQPACQDGATRQFVSGRVRREVQPSATRQPETEPETVPPVSSERREERKASPRWCHPPVQSEVGAGPVGASPQSARLPEWCHSSIRSAANLVPPPNSEWPTGATPQFGSASLVPPPNPGGGSGVIDPGLSAQSCSRPPALVDSKSSPNVADCARW